MIINNEHILSSLPYLKDFFVKQSDYLKLEDRNDFLRNLITNLSEQSWLEFHRPVNISQNFLFFRIVLSRPLNKDDFIFFSFRIVDTNLNNTSNTMISKFIDLYKRDYYFLFASFGVYTDIENHNVFVYTHSDDSINFIIFLKDYNIQSLPFNIFNFYNTNYRSLALIKIYATSVRIMSILDIENVSNITSSSNVLSVNFSKYYEININTELSSLYLLYNISNSYIKNINTVYHNKINVLYAVLNNEIYYKLDLYYKQNNISNFEIRLCHFSNSDIVFYPFHLLINNLPLSFAFGFTYNNISNSNMLRYSRFYRNFIFQSYQNTALFFENRTLEDMNHVINSIPVNGILPFGNVTSGYDSNLFNIVSSNFNVNNYTPQNLNIKNVSNYINNINKVKFLLNKEFFMPNSFTFVNQNPNNNDLNYTLSITYKDSNLINKVNKYLLTNNL
ncbi:MAG: hypothetical protein QXF12_00730 [Candidatus Aenigmatarchaeota archaeon]